MPEDEITQPEEILEPKAPETTPEPKGDDPLDGITDPEVLRAEAKKFRSIGQRKAKETKPEVKPEKPELPTDVVRRSDLAVLATGQAKELVGTEIAEVWDDLMKIPLGGYNPLDPKSIASNVKERFAIYKARKPGDNKPDVSGLSTTTVPHGTGGGEQKSSLKLNLPKKPQDWYKKPE